MNNKIFNATKTDLLVIVDNIAVMFAINVIFRRFNDFYVCLARYSQRISIIQTHPSVGKNHPYLSLVLSQERHIYFRKITFSHTTFNILNKSVFSFTLLSCPACLTSSNVSLTFDRSQNNPPKIIESNDYWETPTNTTFSREMWF